MSKVGTAFFLEVGCCLILTPAILKGFSYGIFSEDLWYYGNTPLILFFLRSGLVSIATVFVVVPMLLSLIAAVVGASSTEEIIRRRLKTAISHLFMIFWFIYAMYWFSSLVLWNARAQLGISILLNPLNLINFIATVVGFFALAFYEYKVLMPSPNKGEKPNLRRIGVVITGLGIYFLPTAVLFMTHGGYHGRLTVCMTMIMPVHNTDFWFLSFIFCRSILLLKSRRKSIAPGGPHEWPLNTL